MVHQRRRREAAMSQIARIQQMEEVFDAAISSLAKFDAALGEFEEAQDDLFAFADYYGSEDWFEDFDASADGILPPDLKRGVLSEDLPYDAIVDYRDLCIRMLELATTALKRI